MAEKGGQNARQRFMHPFTWLPPARATPGTPGLLLTPASHSLVVAGDAALTAGHVMRGQVWQGAADTDLAMESLRDVLEVADAIIPGHDNLFLAPRGLM